MRILFFILLAAFLWCDVTSADEKFTKNSKVSEKGLKNICGDYWSQDVKVSNSSDILQYMRSHPKLKELPSYGYDGDFEKDYEDVYFRNINRKLLIVYDNRKPLFTLTGVYVDTYCEDITNDGKFELIAKINPRGGNASQIEYIISLDKSFKSLEVFTNRFGQEIRDLNGDGIKEIVGVYGDRVWSEFAPCMACQRPTRKILCFEGKRYVDCTTKFTELLQKDWIEAKTWLKSKSDEYNPDSSIVSSLGPVLADFLGTSIKLNKEDMAMNFIDAHFPKEVFTWARDNMGKIREKVKPY